MDADEPVFYHVWFGTKRRKWLLLGEIERTVKDLILKICEEKGINLIRCDTMPEHVHLLLKSRKGELASIVHMLKGASSRKVFVSFPDLKLDAATESFWQTRYGFKIVPPQAGGSVAKYIETQKRRVEKFDRS